MGTNQMIDIKQKLTKGKLGKYLVPWLFLLPGIIFTIWLRYYPIMKSFFMSLYKYDAINPPGRFVGLNNYVTLFSTEYYWQAWRNTFAFLGLSLVLTFFIPIIQALFLNEINKGRRFFTTTYLTTALIPLSINVIIWKWIWHPDYGIANQIITLLGGVPQTWLSDPKLVKFAIIVPGVIGGGVAVLMYLAAIQGISREIIESSQIDGCVGWKKIRYMILPNIKFLIMIQLVMAVIGSMQMLDGPYQYTSGGPSGSSTTMGIYIYNTMNQDLAYGKAAAASVILFIVIGIMTIVQLKMDKSEAE